MPIRFRCPHCARLLGIARRKAGVRISCPQCGEGVTVPREEPDASDQTLNDVAELLDSAPLSNGTAILPPPEPTRPAVPSPFELGPSATATARPPRSQPLPMPPAPTPPPARKRHTGDDSLFELGSVDALLGIVRPDEALPIDEEPKTRPVSGMDALSLDDGAGKFVLSSQKATLLAILAALMIVAAFVAGFVIRSNL